MRFEDAMKFSLFSKDRLFLIGLSSLILSVYLCSILLNYASSEIKVGNLIATLVFIAALVSLSFVISAKKHPPLLWATRGWLILSVLFCFLAAVFTAAEAELSGFFGNLVGYGIMLFVSPYFGFFYFLKNSVMVGLLSMLVSFILLFLPLCVRSIAERRKLMKQYE